jgi:hypothetical protein
MRRIKQAGLALVLGSALAASLAIPAMAWGGEGHQIVVLLAAERMTPAARAAVADLLETPDPVEGMMRDASWADDVAHHGRDETRHWHYVDIEITDTAYDAARDCANDDCVVAQIGREIATLRDPSQPRPARAEALKFLIHFVGDMHQPLHCADNHDRGGNSVRATAHGRITNMHRIWDTAVVNAIGTDARAVAARLSPLISPRLQAAWASGTPASWANECFAIARTQIYGALPGMIDSHVPVEIDDNYTVRVGPITAAQLSKAGVRLAWILNGVFPANDNTAR